MRILYLLTRDLDGIGEALREEHASEHAVEVVDLRIDEDFGRIVDAIAAADRVVSW